ncbi:MAG: lytic murein transglycosylase B [Halomonadaceae bacterium]|nr:MAG: lytic murein transglycosylase B [Halomonadaceae bacterium]
MLAMASAVQADYSQHDKAAAFVDEMAAEHGFDRDQVRRWLGDAQRQDGIIKSISSPAERVLTWKDYRRIFMTEARIRQGREFMEQYADDLARAEQELGVAAEVITAIIGVETSYGRNKGSHRVIDALATLAFDYPPRSTFFRKELGEFLLLSREQGFDPLELKGSYAGAMGYGQFISSSYRYYAIDFDGDGVADIIHNPVDAIGSVANYFKAHRWQPDGAVADPVEPSADIIANLSHNGLGLVHTVADFRGKGLAVPEGRKDSDAARLLTLEGKEGTEHWLVYQNFRSITRYNHSDLYAMAVYQLSLALMDGEPAEGRD